MYLQSLERVKTEICSNTNLCLFIKLCQISNINMSRTIPKIGMGLFEISDQHTKLCPPITNVVDPLNVGTDKL